MDILKYNREAWNKESSENGQWSIPVSDEAIAAAKNGDWDVILTPLLSVPKSWFGELKGKKVLCLASAGGQQAPILAAAGANVTSYDLSDIQLEKDQLVSDDNNLNINCIRGDMADLSVFSDESFDLIFHAVSNCFVPNVETVWNECYRVLKPKGLLLAGFMNPSLFLFDYDESIKTDKLEVKYQLPYAEPDCLDLEGRQELEKTGRPLEFGHNLQSQIGAQLEAGFVLTNMYEDYLGEDAPINRFSPSSIATRALKS